MGNNSSRVTAQDRCARGSRARDGRSLRTDAQTRAILDLKVQRDKLRTTQKKITVLTDRETAIAKELLARGDKKKALLALRRKKYQESLLAKTDAQLEQLEKLTMSVEFAQIQKDVVFGLQQGTKVLQEIHKEMGGIEHVEKLMGETAEAIAYQKVGDARYRTASEGLTAAFADAVACCRRSVRCSVGGYPTPTRRRWRTSWPPSRPSTRERHLSPTFPTPSSRHRRGCRPTRNPYRQKHKRPKAGRC